MASSDIAIAAAYYTTNIQRLCSDILDLPPSCIEFVPQEKYSELSSLDHCFVVGTYHLQESTYAEPALVATNEDDDGDQKQPSPPKPQERDGSLNLFNIRDKKL